MSFFPWPTSMKIITAQPKEEQRINEVNHFSFLPKQAAKSGVKNKGPITI